MNRIAAPYIANLYEYGAYKGLNEKRLRKFLHKPDLDV